MKLGLTVIQNRNSFLMSLQSTSRHERIQRTESGSPRIPMPVCRFLVNHHWQSLGKTYSVIAEWLTSDLQAKTEHHNREMHLPNYNRSSAICFVLNHGLTTWKSGSESWGLIDKLDSRIRDKALFCCRESIICVWKLFEKYFLKTGTNTVLEDWCDNTYHAREQLETVLNQLNTRQSELFTDFWRKVLYSNPSHF